MDSELTAIQREFPRDVMRRPNNVTNNEGDWDSAIKISVPISSLPFDSHPRKTCVGPQISFYPNASYLFSKSPRTRCYLAHVIQC